MTERKFLATLVRGQTYYLGKVRFDKDKPVEIDEAQKEHLEEHAVDILTLSSTEGKERVERQKFSFEEIGAEAEEGAEEGAAEAKPTKTTSRSRTR